jgi:hypothetical protein
VCRFTKLKAKACLQAACPQTALLPNTTTTTPVFKMADPSHTQIPCEVELPKMPTLHQVLEAYRAVCEAVFASSPRPILRHDSVQRLPDIDLTVASRGVQVYKFELDYSGTETGYRDHVVDISADIRKVHRALRKRNMCQEFCGLFDKLLKATLEGTVVFLYSRYFTN